MKWRRRVKRRTLALVSLFPFDPTSIDDRTFYQNLCCFWSAKELYYATHANERAVAASNPSNITHRPFSRSLHVLLLITPHRTRASANEHKKKQRYSAWFSSLFRSSFLFRIFSFIRFHALAVAIDVNLLLETDKTKKYACFSFARIRAIYSLRSHHSISRAHKTFKCGRTQDDLFADNFTIFIYFFFLLLLHSKLKPI